MTSSNCCQTFFDVKHDAKTNIKSGYSKDAAIAIPTSPRTPTSPTSPSNIANKDRNTTQSGAEVKKSSASGVWGSLTAVSDRIKSLLRHSLKGICTKHLNQTVARNPVCRIFKTLKWAVTLSVKIGGFRELIAAVASSGITALKVSSGIPIGKSKQIKTKPAEKLKELWDFLPSFFTENCDFAAFF